MGASNLPCTTFQKVLCLLPAGRASGTGEGKCGGHASLREHSFLVLHTSSDQEATRRLRVILLPSVHEPQEASLSGGISNSPGAGQILMLKIAMPEGGGSPTWNQTRPVQDCLVISSCCPGCTHDLTLGTSLVTWWGQRRRIETGPAES